MTDRELLEAAARAAGFPCKGWCLPGARTDGWWGMYTGSDDDWSYTRWNPLADDGDALRLAAQLRLTVGDDDQSVRSMAFAYARHRQDLSRCYEPSQNDPAAAYRRAIVRAAAEIGRTR